MKRFTRHALIAGAMGAALAAAGTAMAAQRANDFPTSARVEYVLACMSDVTKSYEYLQRCSCAIDTIAKYMTYKQFDEAHTLRSLIESKHQGTEVFRSPDISKKPLDRYYHAEAMAELKCF